MSSVPSDKAGAAAGLYKMASSLGSAFGVAISAAIYTAGEQIPREACTEDLLGPSGQRRDAVRWRTRVAVQCVHVRRGTDLDHRRRTRPST